MKECEYHPNGYPCYKEAEYKLVIDRHPWHMLPVVLYMCERCKNQAIVRLRQQGHEAEVHSLVTKG